MSEGCLEGAGRLSSRCGEVIWWVWGCSVVGVGRLSSGCGEADRRVR